MSASSTIKKRLLLTTLLGLWFTVAGAGTVQLPDGTDVPDIGPLPPVAANPDNAPTEARITLGRALFFDNRISGTGTMSCARVICLTRDGPYRHRFPLPTPAG